MEVTRAEYNKALDIIQDYHKKLVLDGHMPHWKELKKRRSDLGYSMDFVSHATGVSKSTISRLEQGKEVFYSNVFAIARFYSANEKTFKLKSTV